MHVAKRYFLFPIVRDAMSRLGGKLHEFANCTSGLLASTQFQHLSQ